MYNANDTTITPETVSAYESMYEFRFTIYEKELIFRMKGWAYDEKQKLEKEGDDA